MILKPRFCVVSGESIWPCGSSFSRELKQNAHLKTIVNFGSVDESIRGTTRSPLCRLSLPKTDIDDLSSKALE